jgi:hypothetical protein
LFAGKAHAVFYSDAKSPNIFANWISRVDVRLPFENRGINWQLRKTIEDRKNIALNIL